jgi:uncharacterized protein (TIGR01777 family)
VDHFVYRSAMPVSAEALWDWHARPGALERLTPPWDDVRVVARTGGLEDGSRVTLSVPVGPLRIRWVSRHRDCVRGRHFVDEQISGPFARWVHTHATIADGATSLLEDRIEYAAPAGPPGRMLAGWLVPDRLSAMFRYRHDTLRADLLDHLRHQKEPRRTIAITGATGLLGSALSHFLTTGGHRVVRLSRRPARDPDTFVWDPERGLLDPGALPALDAVVHLAGESIAGGRWTDARKAAIHRSRVVGTRTLAESLAALPSPPRTLLCASAVGYYGTGGDPVTEESGPGRGFLAETCQAWEAAAEPAAAAGLRVVHLRIGLVLTPAGGLLRLLLPLFRAGLGGRVGPGTQGMSWVGIDDVVGAFHHALHLERLRGPVNVTAPHPVSNADFSRTLAEVLARPALVPAPSFGVRLVMGREMADETALGGPRVLPARLISSGYRFRHESLEDAMRHLLGRQP